MMKQLWLLGLLSFSAACGGGGDSSVEETNQTVLNNRIMADEMTDAQALEKRQAFLEMDYESYDARVNELTLSSDDLPTTPVNFSGQMITTLEEYETETAWGTREAIGDTSITLDFSTDSPSVTGNADNFVVVEYELTGDFDARDVDFKSATIVARTTGELSASGFAGSETEPLRYYGQLEIFDASDANVKIADATVESISTSGYLYKDDQGKLVAKSFQTTNIISDVAEFSGKDLETSIIVTED